MLPQGRDHAGRFFLQPLYNPVKCSLTATKLARLQKRLNDHGIEDQIRTAAISYDPAFDLSERLRGNGTSRGARMDGAHRLLRPVEGIEPLRKYFHLDVNFIRSVVNRHRIEAFSMRMVALPLPSSVFKGDENKVLNRIAALVSAKSKSIMRRDAPEHTPLKHQQPTQHYAALCRY